MDDKKTIIIKKIKKGGGGGGHGGSWKVAYADFVTAMMAFFLLMWLLNAASAKQKAALADYFQNYSIFQQGGGASRTIAIEKQESSMQVVPAPSIATSEMESEGMMELKKELEKEIEEKLAELKDQVVIGFFEGGVKIDIVDKAGSPMFPSGSTQLTDTGKKILKVISDNIKGSPNSVEIEGHTDAVAYSNKDYSNWELSTDRASAARVELEKNGMDPARLLRVSGYAATEPLIKGNPYDPRNRRISLRLHPVKGAMGGPAIGAPPKVVTPSTPIPVTR